ncbi:MAG: EAL domain-containing protein [Acetivibrio sp.]
MVGIKSQRRLRFIISTTVALLSLAIGLVLYYDSLVINLQEMTCKTLDEVLQQEQHNFKKKITNDKNALKGYAELIAISIEDRVQMQGNLAAIIKSTDFEGAMFINKKGDTLSSGTISMVDNQIFFQKAMEGKTIISQPMKSKVRDTYVIVVATPVLCQGKATGVLLGSFMSEKLNEVFIDSFNGKGYTYIATNTGKLIAKSSSEEILTHTENLFDVFQAADFYSEDSFTLMRRNLLEGRGGHSKYRYKNQYRQVHYAKLNINDWNIFTVVSSKGVWEIANKILKNAVLLIGMLVIIASALFFHHWLSQRQITKELVRLLYWKDVTASRQFKRFKEYAAKMLQKPMKASYMLIKIDIENFRLLNQRYSIKTQNQMIKALMKALTEVLNPETDVFRHIYADGFALLVSVQTKEEWPEKKKKIEDLFEESARHIIGFKIKLVWGRYKLQKGENNLDQIYEKTNFAHLLAESEKGRDVEFKDPLKEQIFWNMEMESKMEDALCKEEIPLLFQPRYTLPEEKIIGAKIIQNWTTEDKIILVSHKNFLRERLELYQVKKICSILQSWIDNGITPIILSFSIQCTHLENPEFTKNLFEILKKFKTVHHLMEIELDENQGIKNSNIPEEVIKKFQKAEILLASHNYKVIYPGVAHIIRMDEYFLNQLNNEKQTKTLLSGAINTAKILGIPTVAENVQTKEQLALLEELGCEMVQGDFLSPPMPEEELEIRLVRNALKE